MGLLDFLFGKKNDKQHVYARLDDENFQQGLNVEKAQKMRDAFLAIMIQDDEDKSFNAASGLMLKGAFNETIEAYQDLAQKYPHRKGDCESQVGAAYHFLKNYDKAIECYVSAERNGADANMMDDNIWEACLAAYQITEEKNYIRQYLEIRPNGNYVKKAKKFL
jgi:tetratricopeptide (TPR) repeat protein